MNSGCIIEVMGSRSTKYGGVERFLVRLIKENPSRKFYIVYDEKPWSENYLKDLKLLGAEAVVIDTRGFMFVLNSFKFYNLVRTVNPDIVHFHFSNAFCLWGPMCRLMKVRRLFKTEHGCLFFGKKQVYDIHETSLKHRFLTQNGNIYKIFEKVFCVSNFVKEQFDKVYQRKGNTSVVYLGTEEPRFISESEKLHLKRELGITNQFVILTVLFADPIKGCDIFVKSLAEMRHMNFVAIIVGMEDNAPLTKKTVNLANELEVDSHIRWIGITDDVYKYMNIADVYVQSSRTEALSLAAVEAESYSMPVIATNTAGLPEVTSELFPYEDFCQLAQKIDFLMDNADQIKMLSGLSYNRWCKLFRIESGVKQYSDYYNF